MHAYNGHSRDHVLHGPSDDKDMPQCLCGQDNPESVGKGGGGVCVIRSLATMRVASPRAGSFGETSP